jgi:hypothetical protein
MNISSLSGVTKAVVALGAGGVLAGAIALGASGSKGGASLPPAQVVAATATSVPEGTSPSPVAVTPRTDCPKDWLPYEDPDKRFSFCYPSAFKIVTDSRNDRATFGIAVYVYPGESDDGGLSLGFTWMKRGNVELVGGSVCASGGGKYPFTSRQETTRTFATKTLEVCSTGTYSDSARSVLDYRTFAAEFPVSDGGVVRVKADYSATKLQEFEGMAMRIVETLLTR